MSVGKAYRSVHKYVFERARRFLARRHKVPGRGEYAFFCNICGQKNTQNASTQHREIPDCAGCGSTPRFRGLAFALCENLFGSPVRLDALPKHKNIKGIGMSDWEPMVALLNEKFDHTNTFYHTEPRYDVMRDDPPIFRNLDYVICSEVFEHVLAPLEVGFQNLRRVLKPGGSLIFSTPYTSAPETSEHFPGMSGFTLEKVDDEWVLHAEHDDGSIRDYDGLIFHGGPGTVLEMRVWSEQHLFGLLKRAGFSEIRAVPFSQSVGYCWPIVVERPEIGYPSLNYIITARC
jgi:SAM-dependent methyltransferase